MTQPSGTADEILKLPSGGGSVSGAGSSFSVDLNTGTLTAGIALQLPTGPNGVVPQLTLRYSSAAGDGPFGRGWSLSTLSILRTVTPSVVADPTALEAYSMIGVGEILDVGGGRWRPAVDATGQRIALADGSWTVTDNKGARFTLGTTAASRIGTDPVVGWLLDSCTDSSGNTVSYTWRSADGWLVPDTVSWGTYKLVFVYEPRPDLLVDGSYGAPVRLAQRCAAIELQVTTEEVPLVRSWQLSYDDAGGLGRSLLASVVEQGHAADGTVLAAPAKQLSYTVAGAPELLPVTGFVDPLDDPDTDLIDLNGDGLPDLLRTGAGRPTVSRNLGNGKFGFPRPMTQAPSPLRLSSPYVAFADMSGAGNADLLVLDRPLAGYYPLEAPGGTAPTGFGFPVVFRQAPNVLPGDPRARFLDLNNDDMTDVLYDTGRAWLANLRSDASEWDDEPVVFPAERTPPVSLTDPHVYLADMTGDGYTDIVHVDGGGVTYWPARADGGWDQAVTMTSGPAPDRDWEPARLSIYDVDGDGCADLVYVGPTSTTVWLNVGADRLAAPVTVPHTPIATPGSYRVVDLFGRGTAGVHFQLPQVRTGQVRQCFLDLTGGVKPGLLSVLTNGPGKTTTVTWKTSTDDSQADARAGAPWPTYHPFPVQCVGRTDETDHGSGVTATVEYHYHNGRYDPATRVWLGFGTVDTEQAGDASCPTLRTETVFHLGLDPADPARPLSPIEALQFGALRRKVLQTTVWGLDGSPAEGSPYSVVTSTYATKLLPATGGQQVAVPYTTTTTEQRWERETTVVSTRLVQYLEVDDEGNITLQRTTATRTGVALPDQDVTTRTTFATGGTNLQLPARVTQTIADGTVIGATVTFYDGEDYVGLPEGQATLGLESRVEDLAFTDDFVTATFGASPPDLTQYGYHRLPGDATGWWITRRAQARGSTPTGPQLSTRGPLGAVQTTQLDAAGQRVVAVTDAMGNQLTATIDTRVWQTASVTDQNGNTSSDLFDALGRVTATLHPADTVALPWATFTYDTGPVSTATAAARIAHGQPGTLASVTYLDGAGVRMGQADPAPTAGEWVVSKAVTRNRRGLPAFSYLPYLVTGAAWQPPPAGTAAIAYVYDALGRIVQKTRADGLVVSTRRQASTLITSEQWPDGPATDIEQQTYDAAGQLISVQRWAGDHWVEQSYTYLPSGRAGTATLPEGSTITIGYDLLGRRWSFESPDTGRTVYVLDACGNERLRLLATSQQVRTEVDAANRVTAIFHDAETTPRVAYSYYDHGDAAPTDGITANRAGRVWQVVDELGTVRLEYEGSGRVVRSSRVVAATGAMFSESYAYDALGRTVSTTLPPTTTGGPARTVDYAYGPDGRLVTASGVVTGATYDLMGRPTTLHYANGAQTIIDYRPNGGTIGRVRVLNASSTTVRDVSVSVTSSLVTGLASATALDDSAAFDYDGLRRLTAADYAQGGEALDTHSWGYDDAFTMTSCSDAGALSYKAGTHQLALVGSTAVAYDTAGRMTAGRAGRLTFDASDHLSEVATPQGHTVAHTYGFQGLRVRSTLDGAETYLAPTDNFVTQGGQNVAWVNFGALRVAAEVDGQLWFLHLNALGATDLLTDASGQDAGRNRLTPYGLTRPGAGGGGAGSAVTVVAVLLSGADSSGLVCLGQRWYDPMIGQFVSPDPFVTGIFIVGSWNPYLYCLGNPLSLRDPMGCDFWDVLEIIGIAVLAAVCVVAAIWTGGATLVALGVLTANLSTGMLIGVSIGALGGAIAGELAAQKAGGSLWAGAFIGALLGGVSSLAGGVLGATVGGALQSTPFWEYLASGAVQGAIAGMGTGLAVGYAGGKGTAEQMLIAAATGAAWGASLGALLGLGSYFLVGNVPAGQAAYLQIGNILNKLDPDPAVQSGVSDVVNTFDNDAGLGNDIGVLAAKFNAPNALGLLPDFVGVQNVSGNVGLFLSNGSLVNIPLGWLPGAVLQGGGFAAAVEVSFAADQAGFSYADQIALLLKGAPFFIDYALTLFQEINPNNDYYKVADAINQAFGSAEPNEYPA
jgi:RHS repeat-associated protein